MFLEVFNDVLIGEDVFFGKQLDVIARVVQFSVFAVLVLEDS